MKIVTWNASTSKEVELSISNRPSIEIVLTCLPKRDEFYNWFIQRFNCPYSIHYNCYDSDITTFQNWLEERNEANVIVEKYIIVNHNTKNCIVVALCKKMKGDMPMT